MDMYFAKHQTFYIRDGWLTKGLLKIKEEPRVFLADDGPEELGLGKNMVQALRFWMKATNLADEVFEDGKKIQEATPLGELIRDYDTYLELDGSLWLIHYHLATSRDQATTWYWFFNHYIPNKFTRKEFIQRLSEWIAVQPDTDKKIAESSLKKDFTCLVKTYLPNTQSKSPEDVMESPLTALGLLSSYTEYDEDRDKKVTVHRLEPGNPEMIHPLVFLYILLHRQEKEREEAKQIGLQNVLREPGNVGRTFNIGITAFEDILGKLNDRYPEWQVVLTRTGGLDQLTLPDVSSEDVLPRFYKESALIGEEISPCFIKSLT